MLGPRLLDNLYCVTCSTEGERGDLGVGGWSHQDIEKQKKSERERRTKAEMIEIQT